MSKKATTKVSDKSEVEESTDSFQVIESNGKRKSKPSVKRTIDGLGTSTVLWQRSIYNPNGDTYDNEDKSSYGQVKKVVQYSRNADFTDLIDWESDVPSVPLYELSEPDSDGIRKAIKVQCRFPGLIPTTAQKAIIKERATLTAMASTVYKSKALLKSLDSLIEGTQHKPSIESTNALVTRLSNELSERCMLLLNKANGIKNKKSDELVDFGA